MTDVTNPVKPGVTGFYDAETSTISYVVRDPMTKSCAIIDSVMRMRTASSRPPK